MKKIITMFFVALSINTYAFPVPEYMKDAEIVVTTKDGKTYKFSGNEYKVVKRTVKQAPVEGKRENLEITPKETLVSSKEHLPRHIVSLEVIHSYGDITTQTSQNSAKAEISKKVGVGAQYQFNIVNDLFLGVRVDSNGGKAINFGVGF